MANKNTKIENIRPKEIKNTRVIFLMTNGRKHTLRIDGKDITDSMAIMSESYKYGFVAIPDLNMIISTSQIVTMEFEEI